MGESEWNTHRGESAARAFDRCGGGDDIALSAAIWAVVVVVGEGRRLCGLALVLREK